MQDFIWFVNYLDGGLLCEIDQYGRQHMFAEIKKDMVRYFGMSGHGMTLCYDVSSGIFNLEGRIVEFFYLVGGKEYALTGQFKLYNDFITYKQATTDLDPINGSTVTQIQKYCFGYKTHLQINEVIFYFKPIVFVPYSKPVYMLLWLVADRDMDGVLAVKRNGQVIEQIPAPLQKGAGVEVAWEVR